MDGASLVLFFAAMLAAFGAAAAVLGTDSRDGFHDPDTRRLIDLGRLGESHRGALR